ncbi:hypothetical protein T492DRAFT_955515 [Pavlovales sp. CCMP2436]|nr:hypothetical protein T492DRAFT_955515 [Pavlovales sp. CCMP2436]
MGDSSSLLLCLLCSRLLPLLRALHAHRLANRPNGVVDVISEILPLVLLPLEQPPPAHGAARMRPRMALRLLCSIIEVLQLWARVINTLSDLETPKLAVSALLLMRDAEALSLFASKEAEAASGALLLKRLAFLLYAGERDQYVGALQGVIFKKLVASLKYSSLHAHVVQAEVLLVVRVLAVRVTPRHLQALWPIALAELKRVLAQPEKMPVRV